MTVTISDPKWMTTEEVAAELRKSRDYVSRQCAAGNLRGKKLGNEWRVSRESVEVFMNGGPAPSTRPERRRAR